MRRSFISVLFKVTSGPHAGEQKVFSEFPLTIGRKQGNVIRLPKDPDVSRSHASIVFDLDRGEYNLRNHDTTHGTVLDGDVVTSEKKIDAEIQHEIRVGNSSFMLQIIGNHTGRFEQDAAEGDELHKNEMLERAGMEGDYTFLVCRIASPIRGIPLPWRCIKDAVTRAAWNVCKRFEAIHIVPTSEGAMFVFEGNSRGVCMAVGAGTAILKATQKFTIDHGLEPEKGIRLSFGLHIGTAGWSPLTNYISGEVSLAFRIAETDVGNDDATNKIWMSGCAAQLLNARGLTARHIGSFEPKGFPGTHEEVYAANWSHDSLTWSFRPLKVIINLPQREVITQTIRFLPVLIGTSSDCAVNFDAQSSCVGTVRLKLTRFSYPPCVTITDLAGESRVTFFGQTLKPRMEEPLSLGANYNLGCEGAYFRIEPVEEDLPYQMVDTLTKLLQTNGTYRQEMVAVVSLDVCNSTHQATGMSALDWRNRMDKLLTEVEAGYRVHAGRQFLPTGDGALLVLDSVSDALEFSRDILGTLRNGNGDLQIRTGIASGIALSDDASQVYSGEPLDLAQTIGDARPSDLIGAGAVDEITDIPLYDRIWISGAARERLCSTNKNLIRRHLGKITAKHLFKQFDVYEVQC